jgi:hypothetical protein
MKIINYDVYGYERACKAAGLPRGGGDEPPKKVAQLGRSVIGSGHDCFLKGITVNMRIAASQVWWMQFNRYHFADIVSSTSKMYSIRTMNRVYSMSTRPEVVEAFEALVEMNLSDQALAMSCPMGLNLEAEIVTNYLQLKTIIRQRKNHKLKEWEQFCAFCLNGLPGFQHLTQKVVE